MAGTVARELKQQKPFFSPEEEIFLGLRIAAARVVEPWAKFLKTTAQLTNNQYNVLLNASPEAIYDRLVRSSSGEPRPMLAADDPLGRIRALKAERDPIYRQAHLVVETERLAPAESADLIYRLASMRG